MNYIDNEYILNNITSPIGEWIASEDSMSGVLEWNHINENVTLMATPNWDEEGWVPFATLIDDEYEPIDNSLELTGSLEEQLNQYISAVSTILSQL